jgi:hypothetical protein
MSNVINFPSRNTSLGAIFEIESWPSPQAPSDDPCMIVNGLMPLSLAVAMLELCNVHNATLA